MPNYFPKGSVLAWVQGEDKRHAQDQVNQENLITETTDHGVPIKSKISPKLKHQWGTDVLGGECVIHTRIQIM